MGLPELISFKDFSVVDLTSGAYPEDSEGLLSHDYIKRKRQVDEAPLTPVQRRKRAMSFRRNKGKIRMGRLRAKRRYASTDKLKARARRQAKSAITKKMMGGKGKGQLSYAQRASVEKQLSRRTSQIDTLARRMFSSVRAKDRAKMHKSK
jgi:hypothetical protein